MNYLKTLWDLIMKSNFEKLLSKEYTIKDEWTFIINKIYRETPNIDISDALRLYMDYENEN